MPPPQVVSVAAHSVSVSFGQHLALDNLSFELTTGSSVALVGPNGSGKTTLLNLLAGLASPTSGTIESAPSAAYVLQHGAHSGWLPLTVDEVLAMSRFGHRGLWRRLRSVDRAAIHNAADRLEVGDLRRRQFGDLSGGQQQRVLVAHAIAQEADLLLLDEPITGLDMASQDRILEVVEDEVRNGRTVALSTHHLDEARHCDRAMLLSTKLIALDHPDVVLTEEHLRAAYGSRLLGTHDHHDHPTDLLLIDDHGHGTH